jgi:hypothetical protein
MILWREWVPLRRNNFVSANFAPVDSRIRRLRSRSMELIKSGMGELLKVLQVLVNSHLSLPVG